MKTALITGATSGIGKATAQLLGRQGYRLIICGRRIDVLEELQAELSPHTEVFSLTFDQRYYAEVEKAITSLPENWREIDILINTGKKLIFVECKSGLVKQEDINKMKIVKQTYGGVIAKSILVCRELPSQSIIEKCKELDIELFYSFALNKELNPLNKLSKVINDVERKASI